MPHNRVLVTDTQQPDAASRLVLRAGQRQRYRAIGVRGNLSA